MTRRLLLFTAKAGAVTLAILAAGVILALELHEMGVRAVTG